MIAMVGRSDRPCKLAEAYKILSESCQLSVRCTISTVSAKE